MYRTKIVLSLTLFLGLAGLAGAQGQKVPALPETSAPPGTMYEDIEVMRRILAQAIKDRWNSLYPSSIPANPVYSDLNYYHNHLSGIVNPLNPMSPGYQMTPSGGGYLPYNPTMKVDKKTFPLEGIYLKGQGVVFILTLPPPPKAPTPTTTDGGPKPLTEWDQVRKQIRGEKVIHSVTPPGKNPTIGDVILKVLADNGQNFSKLAEQEKLTVMVVFRSGETARVPANQFMGYQLKDPKGNNFGPGQDIILLGDQQLKLGRPKSAIQAYLKAAGTLKNPKDSPEALELGRKLAQAYLADGQLDQAKQLIDSIAAKKPPLPPKTVPSSLPTRLIISAPKGLLDQVGSGKVSFEEFRRRVSIEEISPGRGLKEEIRP